ncbi:hypothetical protein B0H13DRAFT_1881972 [Mycena leptocephala]|nr:hypothetical protein B0H13DRAFT_1881972 [Mycena leptocephala]
MTGAIHWRWAHLRRWLWSCAGGEDVNFKPQSNLLVRCFGPSSASLPKDHHESSSHTAELTNLSLRGALKLSLDLASAMEKTSAAEEDEKLEDYSYTTLQLGVWRLLLPQESFSSKFLASPGFSLPWDKWNAVVSSLPIIWHFLTEIYLLSPGLVLLVFVLGFGIALEGTLMLYASTRLLTTVEVGLTGGRTNVNEILQAVVIQLFSA